MGDKAVGVSVKIIEHKRACSRREKPARDYTERLARRGWSPGLNRLSQESHSHVRFAPSQHSVQDDSPVAARQFTVDQYYRLERLPLSQNCLGSSDREPVDRSQSRQKKLAAIFEFKNVHCRNRCRSNKLTAEFILYSKSKNVKQSVSTFKNPTAQIL